VASSELQKRGYTVITSPIEELDQVVFDTTGGADVITAIGVLHHIVVDSILQKALGVLSVQLRDDGILFISTRFRNLEWWIAALDHAGLVIESIQFANEPPWIKKHDDVLIVRKKK